MLNALIANLSWAARLLGLVCYASSVFVVTQVLLCICSFGVCGGLFYALLVFHSVFCTLAGYRFMCSFIFLLSHCRAVLAGGLSNFFSSFRSIQIFRVEV